MYRLSRFSRRCCVTSLIDFLPRCCKLVIGWTLGVLVSARKPRRCAHFCERGASTRISLTQNFIALAGSVDPRYYGSLSFCCYWVAIARIFACQATAFLPFSAGSCSNNVSSALSGISGSCSDAHAIASSGDFQERQISLDEYPLDRGTSLVCGCEHVRIPLLLSSCLSLDG